LPLSRGRFVLGVYPVFWSWPLLALHCGSEPAREAVDLAIAIAIAIAIALACDFDLLPLSQRPNGGAARCYSS
jgi:hypothetical protein